MVLFAALADSGKVAVAVPSITLSLQRFTNAKPMTKSCELRYKRCTVVSVIRVREIESEGPTSQKNEQRTTNSLGNRLWGDQAYPPEGMNILPEASLMNRLLYKLLKEQAE